MIKNSTLITELNPDDFKTLLSTIVKTQLDDFKKELSNKNANDDLLSREQILDLLQINASTLHRWQSAGKIAVYKFANKCFYKRSEIMESLIKLKK
jgi:hypothetical protein